MALPVLVALTLLGANALAAAPCRPTFVLVFVPVEWSADLASFDQVADEAAAIFIDRSGITSYATVQVVKLHEIMRAELTDGTLHRKVADFGLRRAPGDRYIGLTDGDLAPKGKQSIAGWTTMFGNGLIAEHADPVNVAHELGHTFGLCDEYSFEAWRGSNGRGSCPNPFPDDCPHTSGVDCNGHRLPSGGYSIMGPSGLRLLRGFDPACRAALESEFGRLFGTACGSPEPTTPTPLGTPAPTTPAPSGTPGTPGPQPAPSPLSPTGIGRIAFAANRDGHFEIYTAAGDGTGVTRLTFSAGNAYQPVWSPDGLQLAFAASDGGTMQIYLIAADGTNRRHLTQGQDEAQMPAWSPDGRWIAFASGQEGRRALYRVRPDGSDLTRITTPPAGDDEAPAWSPDSAHLVFQHRENGVLTIEVVNFDGTGRRILTTDPAANFQPAWSPDGAMIAFASARLGTPTIWLMGTEGGQQRQVAAGITGWHPSWSADGHWLVVQAHRDGHLRLLLLDPATGTSHLLPTGDYDSADAALAWTVSPERRP